ncbi:MAG TPA: tetratricopeptide repeat protein [Terriglobales bacterium]
MRIFVIPLWFALASLGPAWAAAQEVHLKDGDVIYADHVEDNGDRVRYEVGDNTFTIPKSSVERIIAGTRATTVAKPAELPQFTPETHVGGEEHLLEQVVHEHDVDRSALREIESRGSEKDTAIAYYVAGKTEFEAGQLASAKHDLETALRFDPENPAILNYYGAALVRTGDPVGAISYAERASRIAPDSPDAFAVLGYAQFAAGRLRDSIESWKKSLSLRPDASLKAMIDRAERESRAETGYSERDSSHFILKYEGRQSSDSFRDQLMQVLEADYRDLSSQFGGQTGSSIQVILYTDQAFFDVTRAPAWTGAMNDGKLRIPLRGVDSVTPELARVLRHELTHSFVNQLSLGRCPAWLNEGMAQLMEPRSLGPRAARIADLFRDDHEIPLNMLEPGFASFSAPQAEVAYDEALAAVEFITSRYGMSDLLQIMQRLGEGESTESALRQVLHDDYGQLEEELRRYLTSGRS